MAATFFGYAINPTTDDGTNTADPTAVTPPGSMAAGDLVILWATCRTASATLAISAAGGQTWNSEDSATSTNITSRLFWCRYNGTWSANPSVSFGATTCNSVSMLVFRPTTGTNLWALDQGESVNSYAAPGSPYTVTITGQTTTHISVAVALWSSTDNNTWGTLSGTGWVKTSLPAQNRNSSGQDTSQTWAYQIQTSSGATNNVSQNQATLGGDLGIAAIACFYEYGVTYVPMIGQAVNDQVAPAISKATRKVSGQAVNDQVAAGLAKATRRLLGQAVNDQYSVALARATRRLWGQAINDQTASGRPGNLVRLYGSAPAEATAAALLKTTRTVALTGASVAEATSVALARATMRISGSAVADAVAGGQPKATRRLMGAAAADQVAGSLLKATQLLYGLSSTDAVADAQLTITVPQYVAIIGSSDSGQTAAGLLKATRRLTGAAVADASAAGIAKMTSQLYGASTAEAVSAGRISATIRLEGSSSSEAVAAGAFAEGVEPPYWVVDVDPRERIIFARTRTRIVDADPRERFVDRDWRV